MLGASLVKTTLITRGGLTCRITDKGEEYTKLGRWSWTDYKGVKDLKLRVVCAYRLINTSNSGGTETVHAQHLRALYKLDRHEDPVKAFDKDFFTFLKTSKEEGYQLIVMMDANANLRHSTFKNKKRREGLKDYLSDNPIHHNIGSFERGSDIIDGIFCSSNITVTACSYQTFQQSPGDHRGIEMEINLHSIFGNKKPLISPRPPRRLQCKLTHSVKKYNTILTEFFSKHNMNK